MKMKHLETVQTISIFTRKQILMIVKIDVLHSMQSLNYRKKQKKKKKKFSFCQRLILVPSLLHSLKAEKRFRKSYSILFIPNVLVCLLLQQWHNETFVKEYYQNVI